MHSCIHLVTKMYLPHFRVFAPRCAACQMPTAPQPVSCSAVLTNEREGEEWKGGKFGRGMRMDKEKAFGIWRGW